MKALWRIPDFLDLEYFFIQDKYFEEELGGDALRDRDRSLYQNEIALDDTDTEPDREWLIFRWLQERRSQENQAQGGQALLPGRMWYELYGLFWSLFSFLAMASGAGLAWSFLSYSGEQPVNVSLFFLVFVGFQVCFLFLLILAWSYRKLRGFDLRSSLLLSLVNKGLNGFLFKIRRYGFDSMESHKRSQFAAALTAVRTRGKGYGQLFSWPLFLLFQLFGIAFNFGVLGVFFIKVASSDLAFGWQSTIQLSSQFVERIVQWIALPWSWVLGASSYPDGGQIEGSRMVFKDGFYHLVSSDLVSWWPFLCLAICCYCLLPRMALFVFGSIGRNRSLARISFHRPDHNQLVHRLLSPRLDTTSPEVKVVEEKPVVDREFPTSIETEIENVIAVNGDLLVLIPDELFDDCDTGQLGMLCQQNYGYSVSERVRMDEGHLNSSVIIPCMDKGNDSKHVPILIVQEAWQPPIQEMLRFLREIRLHCGEETVIIVALIGKPARETIFTPVTKTDLQVWQQKTATLNDTCLQISPLVRKR